jgi:hypothetical protein
MIMILIEYNGIYFIVIFDGEVNILFLW